MKKIVFASMMALASVSLVSAPMLRAQDSNHHQGSGRVQHLSNGYRPDAIPTAKASGLGELFDGLSAERRQERRS